jgi:hypothetical protein
VFMFYCVDRRLKNFLCMAFRPPDPTRSSNLMFGKESSPTAYTTGSYMITLEVPLSLLLQPLICFLNPDINMAPMRLNMSRACDFFAFYK